MRKLRDRGVSENLPKGFPGSSAVKSPLANAGDTRLIPGPGRFLMLRSNRACTP